MAVLGNSLDVVRELMSLGADVNTTVSLLELVSYLKTLFFAMCLV